MKNIKKMFVVLALILMGSQAVLALDLGEAKDKGLVGESTTGYVAIVDNNPSSEVRSLVADVNNKRKAIYQKQAEKNGISIGQVEKIAAQRNIEKTQSGHYVQVDGRWVKK